MRALGASTATNEVSTVVGLLHDGSTGCSCRAWGGEGCFGNMQEALAATKPGLAMDGWEEQTCEAPGSPVLACTSETGGNLKEATGARRRRSSILRPRRASSDSM
jgi:hypothetical protein